MNHRYVLYPLLTLQALLTPFSLAADPPRTMGQCDELVRRQPHTRTSYECYEEVARRSGEWNDAARRLEALLQLQPENHLVRHSLAKVEVVQGSDRAEELHRTAIEGFAEDKDASMEIRGRLDLSMFLKNQGRLDQAEAEVARAEEVAVSMGDSIQLAWVRTTQATLARERTRYDRVEQLLQQTEKDVFPDGPVRLRSHWLLAMCMLHWETMRIAESFKYCNRQAVLLHEIGDLYAEASALLNMAILNSVDLDYGWSLTTDEAKEATIRHFKESLDAAIASGNWWVEAASHMALSDIDTTTIQKRRHIRQAIAILKERKGGIEDYLQAQRRLGRSLITEEPRDPERGFRLLDEEFEQKKRIGDPEMLLESLAHRMTLEWYLAREERGNRDLREQAIRSSLEALQATEALRDRQNDSVVKSRAFSFWAYLFEVFAGSLLWPPHETSSPEDVELAFRVMEWKRARVLLEELDAARAIVLSAAGGGETDNESVEVPSLEAVRNALGENEAFLSFQIGWRGQPPERFRGGSWLFLLTRAGTKIYPLPHREDLETAIELFLGLFPNRDGSEAAGAARLYQSLLEVALADLPSEVTRLVIVPDNILYRLPIAALRPAPESEPVGVRYQISLVPSAATWLRLRQDAVAPLEAPALALVDPEIPQAELLERAYRAAGNASAGDRNLSDWGPLARLPRARDEGRALHRYLGHGCRVLEGPDASERFVKEVDLRRYRILHFATHGLVNDRRPERSALLLASGDDAEDGMLRAGEVMGLKLAGNVVVLSACRTAAGPVLEGEGVLSLARPFLVAGAHAVIGSHWRLRDDEAALMLADFYRRLGEGMSLAEGLAAARSDRLRAGTPAEAWAGLVLMGDGSLVPFPGGRPASGNGWFLLLAVPLLAVLAAGFGLLWRRRSHRVN